MRSWVGNAGALAVIVALLGLAYGIGKDTNAGLAELLKEEKSRLEASERRLQAEVSSLKLELQSAQSMGKEPSETICEPTAAVPDNGNAPSQSGATREIVQLKAQTSASFFDGEVMISLIGLSFEGYPIRHKVTATIGAPGKENIAIDKADVGAVYPFGDYEIRIVASDTFSATFLVIRKDA